jgi:hypothetical protein
MRSRYLAGNPGILAGFRKMRCQHILAALD